MSRIPVAFASVKGTIRQRRNKDGSISFICQVKAGRDPVTGKQRVLTGSASSQRAANKLVHELVTRAAADEVRTADVTLNDVIDRWLELGGPPEASTRATYLGYIKNHIRDDIGRTKLAKLKPQDLDRWYVRLRDKGLAPSSIRKCHVIVTGSLTQARKWGWIAANPAQLASPPPVPKAVIATPDPDQVRAILKAARATDPELAVCLRVAVVTGARPGEVCGLQWKDIDWTRGELVIRRRVSRTETSPVLIDLTKTKKTRTVPLDRATLDVLQAHHDMMQERASAFDVALAADAHIFSNSPTGDAFWQPHLVSRRFRTLLDRNKLPPVTLYSLRHQAATVMIDAGVDAKTVSERLGNSVTTVLSTYTRARTAADRAAADLMGSLYET
jgi:integrase